MTTPHFARRAWIVPAAFAFVAGHLLIPYLLFRATLSIAAISVLLLFVGKHAAAAATIWWARRRHRGARR